MTKGLVGFHVYLTFSECCVSILKNICEILTYLSQNIVSSVVKYAQRF